MSRSSMAQTTLSFIHAEGAALMTRNGHALNRLVAKIRQHARHSGVKFNFGKCGSMHFHIIGTPKSQIGEQIKEADESSYLGGITSKQHNIKKQQVQDQISACFGVLNKLNTLWFKLSFPTKFKFDVFDAVIRSKLVYV